MSSAGVADVPKNKRFVLVQFLFSLGTAEIARRFADLRAMGYDEMDVLAS